MRIIAFIILFFITALSQTTFRLGKYYVVGHNLVKNYSFENYTANSPSDNFDYWVLTSNGGTVHADTNATDGTVNIKIVTSGNAAFLYQNISVKPNTLYVAGVDGKVSSGSGGFRVYDNTNSSIIYNLWSELNTTEYNTYNVIFKTKPNTTSIYIRIGYWGSDSNIEYYDHVFLYELRDNYFQSRYLQY